MSGRPTVARCVLSIVTLAVLAGCHRQEVDTTPPQPVQAASSTDSQSDSRLYSVLLPGRPQAEIRTDDLSTGRLAQIIRRELPSLEVSACLERAAAAHHRLPPELVVNPPMAFTEFALHWAGCPDPSAVVTTLLTAERGDEVPVEHLRSVVDDGVYTHVGMARSDAESPYRDRWIALIVQRRMTMNPVPASVEPGTSFTLQFRLAEGFDGAAVVVTRPSGKIENITPGFDDSLVVSGLTAGTDVGETWLELVAHDRSGPQVLALFPVQVGRTPPTRWVGRAAPDESWIETTEQAEAFAARLIDEDRGRFGLPSLVWVPELAKVARGHSEDMARAGFFAHVSPATGTIRDRLRATGLAASYVAENIAMSPSLAEAQARLMRSPGHRAAILATDTTHFGVGVATVSSPEKGTIRYVTQIYVRW